MKKTGIFALILVFALSLSLFAFIHNAGADAGDYSGDYDYGGSDSYDYDYGSFYDDDYDYGSGSLGSSTFGDFIAVAVVFGIIFLVAFTKGKKNNRDVASSAAPKPATGLSDILSLKEKDPAFSEADMKEHVSNLYVRLQNAWTAKDLSPVRPYLSDALFAQFDRQLDSYRSSKTTNRVEKIAVLGVILTGWRTDGTTDSLFAEVRTRICDYVVSDADGRTVRGSATAEKFMTYEWELTRPASAKTGEAKAVHNCPNCGAPLDINRTAKCEYCGSVVTVKDYDWALTSIKGLSQRTVGK